MADIVISYKREEQQTAPALTDALGAAGWTGWWNPKLRAGEHFDDAVEQAIRDAKCVIVLWSKLSTQSEYVKDEANFAKKRGFVLLLNMPGRVLNEPGTLRITQQTIDRYASVYGGSPAGLPDSGKLSRTHRLLPKRRLKKCGNSPTVSVFK